VAVPCEESPDDGHNQRDGNERSEQQAEAAGAATIRVSTLTPTQVVSVGDCAVSIAAVSSASGVPEAPLIGKPPWRSRVSAVGAASVAER
jgi:hypothetical protein